MWWGWRAKQDEAALSESACQGYACWVPKDGPLRGRIKMVDLPSRQGRDPAPLHLQEADNLATLQL